MKAVAFARPPRFFLEGEGWRCPVFVKQVPPPLLPEREAFRRILTPLYTPFRYLLTDGFIERKVGFWIQRYCSKGMILDCGMGDGRLMKYVPASCRYAGFDLTLRPETIKGAIRRGASIFLASVADIPLPDNSVDYLLSTEVLEHVPNFARALAELYRVGKPGAKLFVSIPNNYSYKYRVKGPHPDHVNSWRYKEFVEALAPRFRLVEGTMSGWWLPAIRWSRISIQFPLSHPDEKYNTNFLYVFESTKKSWKGVGHAIH